MVKIASFILFFLSISFLVNSQSFEKDTYETSIGDLEITFIGHGSLLFKINGLSIFVDPSAREADYSQFEKADLILITHHHGDHCDNEAVNLILKEDTKIITTALAVDKLGQGNILKNDERTEFGQINIEAIPAYNLIHKRENGEPFHPKGTCNSYVINFGQTRVFIGGDTENTPEMKALKNIDIAFLPMNLPYTMTPEMVADAAMAFRPTILYPYHTGNTDTSKIIALMKNESDIKTVIRKMP